MSHWDDETYDEVAEMIAEAEDPLKERIAELEEFVRLVANYVEHLEAPYCYPPLVRKAVALLQKGQK
jgi:hypothetical protein